MPKNLNVIPSNSQGKKNAFSYFIVNLKPIGNDSYFKICQSFVHLLIYLNADMISKYCSLKAGVILYFSY